MLARYLHLSTKDEEEPPSVVDTAANSTNHNSNNSNGNVDDHFDVEQMDLGNAAATRSVIQEQSRILAQLR